MAKKLINTKIKIGEGVLSQESIKPSPRNNFNLNELLVIKRAGMVIVSGIVRGNIPQNIYTTVGVLPEGFRPLVSVYSGAATVGGNVGFVYIGINGEVQVNQRTGREDLTWMAFSLPYFI